MNRDGIHRKSPSHIRPRRLLHTCFFQPQKHTKKQRQKQRQQYWNHIHHLRNLNPQLSINPKAHTQLTSPRSNPHTEFRRAPHPQQSLHRQGPHPQGSQIPPPPHHSPKYMRDGRIRRSHWQQGKLHTSHRHQTLQHHHIPTTSRHDLTSPTTFTRTQRKKIKKWLTPLHTNHTLTSTALPHNHPLRPHTFHQPTTRATHTPCNCNDTGSTRQTQRFRQKDKDRRRKQYNFPHKNARHMRPRPPVSMDIHQSNPNTCHPQFNPQPLAPIPPTNTSRPSSHASSKHDEIEKGTRQGLKHQPTNENICPKQGTQIHKLTNHTISQTTGRKHNQTNQRQEKIIQSTNQDASLRTNRIDLYTADHAISVNAKHIAPTSDSHRPHHNKCCVDATSCPTYTIPPSPSPPPFPGTTLTTPTRARAVPSDQHASPTTRSPLTCQRSLGSEHQGGSCTPRTTLAKHP